MKLLHTSDWHLGRVLHERSLLEDQAVFLAQLIAVLGREPHDALLVAGDIFDRGIAPEEAVMCFSHFLRDLRAACPTLPVIVIAGNHDSAARLAYGASVFATAEIHIRAVTGTIGDPVRLRDAEGVEAEVWAVPFLWPGSLSAHQDGAATPGGTQVEALVEAVRIARAGRSPRKDVVQVLMAHCFAVGGGVSDSERTLVGNATQVATSLFDGFDYVALGHLHRPQRVTDHAWYSGSPLKYSFSEAGDSKAFLSVSIEPGKIPAVTRVPVIPPRDMAVLRGQFRDLLENPLYLAVRDRYLRIELDAPEPVAQPMVLLRRRFPFLLDFRMPDPNVEGTGGAHAVDPRDRADVEQDFLDFERRIRGDNPLPDGMLEAFRALRVIADKEAVQ